MNTRKLDIADNMADVIVARIRECGDYTDDDLKKAGFTDEDIRLCGPLAYGFACVQLHNQQARHAG